MDKYDYHFISIKFLTAILLALIFAFLLIYVFTPQQRADYAVYSLDDSNFQFEKEAVSFDLTSQIMETNMMAEKIDFQEGLKTRTFELMEQSKKSILAVITANYLEKMNGLREERMLSLEAKRRELDAREDRLIQEKRQELEANLSQKLQQLRQEIRDEYSDFNQQEIRSNYLKIINLRLKIEFIARNETEREKYQQQLEDLISEQEAIVSEKNSQLNQDISNQTTTLITEFNQQFATYREEIRNEHQKILSEQSSDIENELTQARKEIKNELTLKREQKRTELNQLIEKNKVEYY